MPNTTTDTKIAAPESNDQISGAAKGIAAIKSQICAKWADCNCDGIKNGECKCGASCSCGTVSSEKLINLIETTCNKSNCSCGTDCGCGAGCKWFVNISYTALPQFANKSAFRLTAVVPRRNLLKSGFPLRRLSKERSFLSNFTLFDVFSLSSRYLHFPKISLLSCRHDIFQSYRQDYKSRTHRYKRSMHLNKIRTSLPIFTLVEPCCVS